MMRLPLALVLVQRDRASLPGRRFLKVLLFSSSVEPVLYCCRSERAGTIDSSPSGGRCFGAKRTEQRASPLPRTVRIGGRISSVGQIANLPLDFGFWLNRQVGNLPHDGSAEVVFPSILMSFAPTADACRLAIAASNR